jgi:phosphocarrier protein HPr
VFRKEIVINNKTGLHARPASELVEFCNGFVSEIALITDADEEINAKSIISILGGEIYQGTKVVLQVEGSDEKLAGPQIAHFLENISE